MAYFNFSAPLYLNFLFLIPFVIFVYVFTLRSRHKRAIPFANIDAIERVSGIELFSRNLTPMFLTLLAITCITFALAGTSITVSRPASAFSYVLAIDASSSMSAKDIEPTRLAAAKDAAIAFIKNAPLGTRVGIVSFGGTASVQTGVIQDKMALREAIAVISLEPVGGTNILEAIIASSQLLKGEDEKAVILFSDGQLNVDTIEEILDYTKRNSILVHTFGVGTVEGGQAEYFISKLDEDALKALAHATGGRYYAIRKAEDFGPAFSDILVATQRDVKIELGVYLLIAGLVLIALNWTLSNTRWRAIP